MSSSEITLDSRVRPSDKTLFRNVEGEAVLLGLNAGSYFGLDPVGTRIWELIAERSLLSEVLSGIVAEFEVDAARAEADLLKLVHGAARKGTDRGPGRTRVCLSMSGIAGIIRQEASALPNRVLRHGAHAPGARG